ncbi:hypothetical protein M5689_018122 [Euphorbia peplus]|nr:hypothetical protein M5689_018122 [Euphorbia peplus]
MAFLSFAHSSRTSFGVYQRKAWVKRDFESYGGFRRLGKVSWVKRDLESYGGLRRLGKVAWVKQDFESYGGFKSLGEGGSDLAREVPSGPDPLHHNIDKPSRH